MYLKFIFTCSILVSGLLEPGLSVENISNSALHCFVSDRSNSYNAVRHTDEIQIRSEPSAFHSQRRGKWISQIFYEAREKFFITQDASNVCQRDFWAYEQHLDNHSAWAVQMLESSEWPQVGIFAGMAYHLGNYDECLRIVTHNIKGQYCLVETKYDLIDYVSTHHITEAVEWPLQEISVWDAMEMYRVNPVRQNRKILNWALCIPSSCSSNDLERSLNHNLPPIFSKYGIKITAKVNSKNCQVKREVEVYPSEYYYVRMAFYSVLSLVLSMTIYDLLHEKKGNGSQFLRSFSVFETCKKLITFNLEKEDMCIHFLKFILTALIIYGHRFMNLISFPIFDTERMEIGYKSTKCISLIHMTVVDAFIYFSGYLTYRFNHSKIQKNGIKEVFILCLNRWLRLVPTFSFLTFFIAYVFPYQNDGPLWGEIITESEICKSNWLKGLLAVSNIIQPDKLCFFVSWFVSVDIQLTLLSGLLMAIMVKNIKLGLQLTGTVLVLTTIITFVTIFKNEYNGFILLYFNSMQNMRSFHEFTRVYVTFSARAGPYLIGLMFAVLCDKLKERNYTFSKIQVFCGIVLSILVGEVFTFYGSVFYEFGKNYSAVEHAVYGTFHRMVFVLPFAISHLMDSINGLSILEFIAVPKLFIPLSRLSYSVFLVNLIIQMYHTYSQRVPMPVSSSANLFWIVVTDVIYSYTAGFLLHVFIEAPFGNFSKIIIDRLSRYSKNVHL